MRNLVPYPHDPFNAFQRIVQSKEPVRRDLLLSVSEEIHQHYEYYSRNRNQIESILPRNYEGEIKVALLHCYDSDTNALDEMIVAIRQSQHVFGGTSNRCQYCVINTDSTVDHYLPKSAYPEFAVYALNLVPCCSECNNFKGETIMINGHRQFVNLYFDSLPARQFLHVGLAFRDDGVPCPTYYIEEIPEISGELVNIINNHSRSLQLNRRYSEGVSEIVSEIMKSIIENDLIGKTAHIVQLLRDEAAKHRRSFGLNYWKSVFIEALAESEHFFTRTVPAVIANPNINLLP